MSFEKFKYNFVKEIKYNFGRLIGGIEGVNSTEKSQEMILSDIRRTKKEMRVVSCTLDESYWDKNITDALEKKISSKPETYFEFLVGPTMNNPSLKKLANKGKIKLISLKEKPPCDCRIIDQMDTYTSNHGDDGSPRRYSWTFGNVPALKDRVEYYNSLKKKENS